MEEQTLTVGLHILGICAVLVYGNDCGQSEYLSSADECCPMCNIGLVVLRDCTGPYSTMCKPCSKGTYMNAPNGLNKCFPCKTCDKGLSASEQCSTIKDTVCDVLGGYYCKHYNGKECIMALKHSKCEPGQQIKTPGTKTSDTVCELCSHGYYSPEGENCTKWTDCSIKDMIQDEEGSSVKDVQCKQRRMRYFLIPGFVINLMFATVLLFLYMKQRSLSKSNKMMQPGHNDHQKPSQISVEETNNGSAKLVTSLNRENEPEENLNDAIT
ncbi:tumor necrosis factor receptor superfamily member 14-like isoform X1 [Trichomycterus rosablanca]|uniref:tumor necrosis factor receptor superfamily member 14-like isoform X1 n=1 Tax=Trichomycterus rosablanca TaxID=2290929 RepID=UPI002F356C39